MGIFKGIKKAIVKCGKWAIKNPDVIVETYDVVSDFVGKNKTENKENDYFYKVELENEELRTRIEKTESEIFKLKESLSSSTQNLQEQVNILKQENAIYRGKIKFYTILITSLLSIGVATAVILAIVL